MRQHTIRKAVSLEGVGLHSGKTVRVTLAPAPADSGIVFRVGELGEPIPATPESVVDSHYATTVGRNGARIQTVEHLMAAAAGLGLDNLIVDVSSEELPGLDGSAKEFLDILERGGQVPLPALRRPIRIDTPIRVEDGTRWLRVFPCDTFRVSYTLDHDHPAIGLQAVTVEITPKTFAEDVAPARTYGFLKDVGAMRQRGLARGGSLDNTIVVGKRTVLNESLRFPDEFVRHKILDLVGDLFLLGRPIRGHVVARNAGHAMNHQLVAAIRKAAVPERRRFRSVAPVEALVAEAAYPSPGVAAL